jgi:hypothetical protein
MKNDTIRTRAVTSGGGRSTNVDSSADLPAHGPARHHAYGPASAGQTEPGQLRHLPVPAKQLGACDPPHLLQVRIRAQGCPYRSSEEIELNVVITDLRPLRAA